LDDLLQDYLFLVRVGAVQLVPADMRLFVTQFAQEITSALTAHGITLQLEGLSQLGQVALHQNTFRRVLLNLVHNAIDAMPQGGTLSAVGF
jgi:signal transduction histidine kinase